MMKPKALKELGINSLFFTTLCEGIATNKKVQLK